jgi:hypothetical protein
MSLGDDKSKKVLFDSIGIGVENLEENEVVWRNIEMSRCLGYSTTMGRIGFGWKCSNALGSLYGMHICGREREAFGPQVK